MPNLLLKTQKRTKLKKSILACIVISLFSSVALSQEDSDQPESPLEQKLSNINLSKVVVTAGGFAQDVKSAPASISVISNEELEVKPFRDVTDALRDVPGVTITGGGGSSDISIRGMSPSYTLMMIDGKRQNSRGTRPNSDGPGIEQGWIPPLAAIERIEVVRGPMSSLYGSDAMGGVINIITKKISSEWGGNVRLETTLQEDSDSGNSNTAEFFLNGPLIRDRLGLQLMGKYSGRHEDNYKGGYPEQRLDNIAGKLVYVPVEGHTIEAEYGSSFQKRYGTFGKSAGRSEDKHKSKRTNEALRYLGNFGDIKSDFLVSHEKINNYSRQMIMDNLEVNGNVVIPISTHTITLGGQYRKEKLNDKGNQFQPDLTKLSRWTYSLFVEDEWWIVDNVAITAGLRYDKDENFGSQLNPRIYGVWLINDQFSVKGGISTGFAAPALRSVVADWGQVTGHGYTDGVILGNPNLKPEKTLNYEASFTYTPNDKIEASITGFYTKFKNKIQIITSCDDETETNQCIGSNGKGYDFIQNRENVDRATLKGIELSAKALLPYDIMLTTSYTWTDTEQTSGPNKGKPLNRIPKHQWNLGADWQLNEKTNIWTKGRFHSKETEITRTGGAGKEYSSYTLLDLGASYKVNHDTTLYAGVYNITDKRIRSDTFGRVLDGRRYWLGVNVDF